MLMTAFFAVNMIHARKAMDDQTEELANGAAEYAAEMLEAGIKKRLEEITRVRTQGINNGLTETAADVKYISSEMSDLLQKGIRFSAEPVPNGLYNDVPAGRPLILYSPALLKTGISSLLQKEIDMARGKGFLIKEPPVIQKALKRTDSIYSELFTKTLQDPDSYTDRYSCECKFLQGKDYDRMICPKCRTKVQFVGEDFEMTGWITIKDEYAVIHPNLYRSLSKYIGTSTLETILEPEIDLDIQKRNQVMKLLKVSV